MRKFGRAQWKLLSLKIECRGQRLSGMWACTQNASITSTIETDFSQKRITFMWKCRFTEFVRESERERETVRVYEALPSTCNCLISRAHTMYTPLQPKQACDMMRMCPSWLQNCTLLSPPYISVSLHFFFVFPIFSFVWMYELTAHLIFVSISVLVVRSNCVVV